MTDREKRFHESLKSEICPTDLPILVQSLWHDGRENWAAAHALIDDLPGAEAAWVHAYLHRKEGDMANADYWYSRAKKKRPSCSLEQEWSELVTYFIDE